MCSQTCTFELEGGAEVRWFPNGFRASEKCNADVKIGTFCKLESLANQDRQNGYAQHSEAQYYSITKGCRRPDDEHAI